MTRYRSACLLVEEIEIPGENHRPVASHLPTLTHIMFYRDWLEKLTRILNT
jgi:hypothetical protein